MRRAAPPPPSRVRVFAVVAIAAGLGACAYGHVNRTDAATTDEDVAPLGTDDVALGAGDGAAMGDGTASDPCADAGAPRTTFGPNNPVANAGTDGAVVMGVCVASVFYCNATGTAQPVPGPDGYAGGNGGSACDYNACTGAACQRNFCRDCRGDCTANCP